MAAIQQNGSPVTGNYFNGTSTKNQGGTAIKVGSASKIVNNLGLGTADVGVFASVVVPDTVTVNDYAAKGLSGGVFSYNNQSPVAMRITKSISTVSNTALQNGADTPGLIRGINKLEVLRSYRLTSAYRAGQYNIFTNVFSSAPTVAVDSLATDVAAVPSMAAPGRLTYKTGKYVPVNDNYKAKTV